MLHCSVSLLRTKNHSFLYELSRDKKYLSHSTPQLVVPHDSFSSVAAVITNNTDDKFWVKVHAEITNERKGFGMACDACLKSTSGQYEWKIMCNFCNTETLAKPRAKLVVTVTDNLTPLDVMLFGELAEIVLGTTALQIMKLDDEDQKLNCININKDLQQKEFIIQIKKRKPESHFGVEYRYTVVLLVQSDQLPMKTETETATFLFKFSTYFQSIRKYADGTSTYGLRQYYICCTYLPTHIPLTITLGYIVNMYIYVNI